MMFHLAFPFKNHSIAMLKNPQGRSVTACHSHLGRWHDGGLERVLLEKLVPVEQRWSKSHYKLLHISLIFINECSWIFMNEAVLEDVVCIVHILLARFPESISMTRFADKLSIASDQASVSAETKSSKCEAPKWDDGGWVWLQVYEIHEILEKVGLLMTADPWLTKKYPQPLSKLQGFTFRAPRIHVSSRSAAKLISNIGAWCITGSAPRTGWQIWKMEWPATNIN